LKETDVSAPILPEIDHRLCIGCGDCIPVCKPLALALVDGKAVIAAPDVCEYEGGCEPVCPVGAIQLPFLVVFGESIAVSKHWEH
jgi:MinD superfamily P-loop ATPase